MSLAPLDPSPRPAGSTAERMAGSTEESIGESTGEGTVQGTGRVSTPARAPGVAQAEVLPAPLVVAQNVSAQLGGRSVLQNVSLEIAPGEIVTIVGPNGSGKSTLLRCLIGAVALTAGEVRRAPGVRLGYVPQTLRIDQTLPLTVARFLSLPRRRARGDIAHALEAAGLPDLGRRQMSELSGGQFQRVLLARALLEEPDLLLLDEPTQGLDQQGSAAFYRQIEEVRREMGVAVVMVSHELHVVMSASDRVICLNGHICCQGAPAHVASAPEYRALFGTGTDGALALYRHEHDHRHDGPLAEETAAARAPDPTPQPPAHGGDRPSRR